ncbi:hypothetical protein TNCT_203081 [Trichonephila clavata]|uniref:Uncharacterized protein n=1 Tax=Trichonephila clavata TaxID=2740835 RepID=A0A8X6K5H5_TRICU|nr:hypothetical protein TNCT_203081 [Trichonephila clavata]
MSALSVLICAVFDFMNPLYDSHALAQLLDSCWMNDTSGSTNLGLQRMSDVLKGHGVVAFTVDNSSMQSDFYPLVILLLLGQAISFHSARLVLILANYDDLCCLVNFVQSSTFKRLNLRMNIDSIIERITPQLYKLVIIFFSVAISEILCMFNTDLQRSAKNEYLGVHVFASNFSVELSFNSNWTAECDYTVESRQINKCSFKYHDSLSDLLLYEATCNFTSNRIDYFLYNYLKIYFFFLSGITFSKTLWILLCFGFFVFGNVFVDTACYQELLEPCFIRLESIIYQCTPEKIFLLNFLSSNLDSPDIELTVKELAKKLTEEHCMDLSDSYLFSISDPDESA